MRVRQNESSNLAADRATPRRLRATGDGGARSPSPEDAVVFREAGLKSRVLFPGERMGLVELGGKGCRPLSPWSSRPRR